MHVEFKIIHMITNVNVKYPIIKHKYRKIITFSPSKLSAPSKLRARVFPPKVLSLRSITSLIIIYLLCGRKGLFVGLGKWGLFSLLATAL